MNVGWNGAGHVRVDAEELPVGPGSHLVDDDRTPVASLRREARVSEALHQHRPGPCDVLRIPAGRGRLPGKPEPGERRDHQMKRVRRARAVRRRIGQRIDDLQLLDDRAGPSVRDDERQRILVLRANVDEMNVQAVDLGDEVRQGVQSLLAPAPVVLLRPVARERLHRREPRALRQICDGLLFGPARGQDARTQVIQIRLGDLPR